MRERERSGVKIDFCPACKGVWLDRGELDKIIEIELSDDFGERDFRDPGGGIEARNAENARLARRDDDDDDDRRSRGRPEYERTQYERKPGKRRSFFENLSDILGGE